MTLALTIAVCIVIAVAGWRVTREPLYEMRHNDLPAAAPVRFGLADAPAWLTRMPLWADVVLSLRPGQSVRTQYRTITRVR